MKTIKLGYEGDETVLLCQALVLDGYTVAESRTFPQKMKDALVDFQQSIIWMPTALWVTVAGKRCCSWDISRTNS